MNTQTWSKHVIVVRLPPEPRTGDELETVTQIALNEPDFDVVMDFADVPTMSYPALVGLMILYRTLGETGRRLAFCNTAAVREVFQAHRISSALAGNCEEGVILEPPADSQSSGTLVLGRQNRAGMCERRRYVRLNVSRSLKRRVQVWPSYPDRAMLEVGQEDRCWHGILVDVSPGGAQVAIDLTQEPAFRKEQFVNLRFAPVPDEPPITFDALIREILSTADNQQVCLGVQFVGLEASKEGRRGLQRLCGVEGRYFQTVEP